MRSGEVDIYIHDYFLYRAWAEWIQNSIGLISSKDEDVGMFLDRNSEFICYQSIDDYMDEGEVVLLNKDYI